MFFKHGILNLKCCTASAKSLVQKQVSTGTYTLKQHIYASKHVGKKDAKSTYFIFQLSGPGGLARQGVAVSNPVFKLTVFFDLSCLVSPYLFSAFG